MNSKTDASFNDYLRERTMKMAVDVRSLLLSTMIQPIDRPIVNQLIRSSTSAAANYCSATCGRSDAEFYSKICVVVEEIDETKFWLNYLDRIKTLSGQEAGKVLDEVDQLVRLFSSIKKKMKEKCHK